jgi:m7GpppX diphosphatase
MDKKLHSIRDLDGTHIELLEFIKTKTLEIIKSTYGFESVVIKMYLHYAPSTYHLHIHFVLVSNTDTNSSCEYSHELSNVIENLKINSDYYKLVVMNKRI